jgi:hypothetical protein
MVNNMKKTADNTKIELTGCILKIKDATFTLTLAELHALKAEIEKVIPSAPTIIREPYYPSPAPVYPWNVPVCNQPQIICDTTDKSNIPATKVYCISGASSGNF